MRASIAGIAVKQGELELKMKKLTSEQIEKMALQQAWDIAGEFGSFLADYKNIHFYEFEDALPYSKNVILCAILKILAEEDFKKIAVASGRSEEDIKEVLVENAITLLYHFMPSEEQYQLSRERKEKVDEILRG